MTIHSVLIILKHSLSKIILTITLWFKTIYAFLSVADDVLRNLSGTQVREIGIEICKSRQLVAYVKFTNGETLI